jgi:hypothetical protein
LKGTKSKDGKPGNWKIETTDSGDSNLENPGAGNPKIQKPKRKKSKNQNHGIP